ncbi:hypothetical protein EMIHUDRAFT_237930 [Emiliania huxleyi CCMP1516]|uniref:Uncharacterized protein n=2 Tax=Emiliania huxleyi TaxID=2903 RepID=A0A0D3JP55_EMIH1|nr:hypothetical protein EMIHUDRAFT_237930 [Emiliania huxleyi CCMP1516]EOD25290.1 hypothetical protein EMIHUDRAFT_237930 [Emiliania huxleyi CCMP1516]|eukprot:XP_005777719.1 hypothetical protein EMIHUDRAFT_237930 [Emiliania huxleyi CCMP1516]
MSDAAWEPLIRSGLFPPPERLPPSQGGPLPPSQGGPSRLLGHMLRNSSIASGTAVGKRAPAWMAGLVHYRLVPGSFPHGMRYHFDGLAEVIRFSFDATGDGGPQSAPSLTWRSMPFESDAFERYQSCLFFGTGTGPTAGAHLCFTNPGVNLLPLRGPGAEQQLWLTIDTASWGRVDPQAALALPPRCWPWLLSPIAHPACDGSACFVQHPCPKPGPGPACFSLLRPTAGDLRTVLVSRATLPRKKLIQHSHSPCVTPRFVLAKLDSFGARTTNRSRVLSSGGARFVNNHFWNCFEDPRTAEVVVETVATEYLDLYSEPNLRAPMEWSRRFQAPLRCRVPTEGSAKAGVRCAPLSAAVNASLPFDYPTFNPLFKARHDYRFFYALAPSAADSKWFDQIVKVDVSRGGGAVAASWARPGVYVTEADFVPRRGSTAAAAEDDGVLLSVLYNSTTDSSSLGVFDARSLALVDQFGLGGVVPFHAHGIVCPAWHGGCFTNP